MYIFETIKFWFEILCRLLCSSHDTIMFFSIPINGYMCSSAEQSPFKLTVPQLLKNFIPLRANNYNKIIFMKTHLEIWQTVHQNWCFML